MAIKLYGISISNYFSTVKAALAEKQLAFEEVSTFPSDKPEVTALSPMGKVPYIEVDGAALSTSITWKIPIQSLHSIRAIPGNEPKQKRLFVPSNSISMRRHVNTLPRSILASLSMTPYVNRLKMNSIKA